MADEEHELPDTSKSYAIWGVGPSEGGVISGNISDGCDVGVSLPNNFRGVAKQNYARNGKVGVEVRDPVLEKRVQAAISALPESQRGAMAKAWEAAKEALATGAGSAAATAVLTMLGITGP